MEGLRATLAELDPEELVACHLRGAGSIGRVLDRNGSPAVIALGKAAPAMARGAAKVLGDASVRGLVVSDHVEAIPEGWRMMLGDHPILGERSLEAGTAVMEVAQSLGPEDVLLALVSGGGSALAEVPIEGVTLSELASLQRSLMAAGTPIDELNVVRRHLSRLKNGGLARAAHPALVATLLISDVIDGPPSAIASGPTLPDGSSPVDAAEVIRARLGSGAPGGVLAALARSRGTGALPDHPHAVAADIETALEAAARHLSRAGLTVTVGAELLRGEASTVARRVLEEAGAGATVLGGETTVTGATSDLGGRNQEAALAAAIHIEETASVFAAFATDGIDGPTEVAGAIVDGRTGRRGREAGLDPRQQLGRHESFLFLEAAGDLVRTGPTGTNVGDIWMVWRPRSHP